MYLLLAVAIKLFFENYQGNKKFLFASFLIIGLASSTFGFEAFQFLVRYRGYQREYIPEILQTEKLADPTKIYPVVCEQLRQAGITRNDLVISDQFPLRYWCEIRLFTTFEEGTVGIMSGKNELIRWYRNYEEQDNILYHGSPDELVAFAKKIGASYALLDSKSDLARAFESKRALVSKGDRFVIIKFNL